MGAETAKPATEKTRRPKSSTYYQNRHHHEPGKCAMEHGRFGVQNPGHFGGNPATDHRRKECSANTEDQRPDAQFLQIYEPVFRADEIGSKSRSHQTEQQYHAEGCQGTHPNRCPVDVAMRPPFM